MSAAQILDSWITSQPTGLDWQLMEHPKHFIDIFTTKDGHLSVLLEMQHCADEDSLGITTKATHSTESARWLSQGVTPHVNSNIMYQYLR